MFSKKSEIVKTIKQLGFPDKEVALTLDTFFNDKIGYGSIGVNIYPNQPSPQTFYDTFKRLLETKKAYQIFVRIADIEEPAEWFFSDTIYVVSDLTLDELKPELGHLHFNEIHKGWMYDKPVNVGDYDKVKNIYSIWWN